MQANRSANKKRASGAQEHGAVQEPFTTRYGPVTIHQNGVIAKELAATAGKEKKESYALEKVRISMHVERYGSEESLSLEPTCVTRFRDFRHEFTHNAQCDMRAGQTHGAAVVQATSINVDFENGHDTIMEVEFLLGEESVCTVSIPIKFPEGSPQAQRTQQLSENQQ